MFTRTPPTLSGKLWALTPVIFSWRAQACVNSTTSFGLAGLQTTQQSFAAWGMLLTQRTIPRMSFPNSLMSPNMVETLASSCGRKLFGTRQDRLSIALDGLGSFETSQSKVL